MAKRKKELPENIISKSFSQWTIEDIKETFQLLMVHEGKGMEEIMHNNMELTDRECDELEYRRLLLIKKVGVWNEIELEIFFLVHILELLKMAETGIETFIEKPYSAIVDTYLLSGEMDWVLANGYGKPKAPFFCIKEFKKAKSSSNDPEGQLAAGMLAAQALNQALYPENTPPIYGAYIMGREWIFAKLQGRTFIQSPAFLLTDEAMLQKMFRCLKQLKTIMVALHASHIS